MKATVVAWIAAAVAAPAFAQEGPGLLVSAEWLEAHASDAQVVVLHAETQRERYAASHIPGARFLDMQKLVWEGEHGWGTEMREPASIDDALEEAGVSDGDHIVIYGPNPLHASRAFLTFEVMGLQGRVSLLDGGLGGWQGEGRAVSSEEPSYERGSIRLRPRADVLVDADWVRTRLDDPAFALVDARPDDEYTGADGGMGGRTAAGHIPGAAQMYWEELVESRALPRVKDRAELERLFLDAGATDGKTVVAYCMVGWRASFTYFAARLLGYDAKFYDGSWHDWGTRDGFPVVSGRARR